MCDLHLWHSYGCRKCFLQNVLHVNCQVEHELSWLFHCFNCKRIHLNCKLVKFCSNSCLKKSSNHHNQLFSSLSSPWNIFLAYPYELVGNSTYIPFPSPAPNYELHVLCFLLMTSLRTMPGFKILTSCRWLPIQKTSWVMTKRHVEGMYSLVRTIYSFMYLRL
jgi:hypothetical protein